MTEWSGLTQLLFFVMAAVNATRALPRGFGQHVDRFFASVAWPVG
eukprot:SAG31_NODE_32050_length_360_cov_1.954023_1_plen_44_part_01